MDLRNESLSYPSGKSESDDELVDLAERCRVLAADIERIRSSRAAVDRGDGGLAVLQDGHDRSHAVGYRKELPETQPLGGSRRPRLGRIALLILLAGAAILGGLWMWLQLGTYESTDDAQIDGHVIPMSTRISGTVALVYVENTQFVRAGSLLADLDIRDYGVAVEKARADLEQAKAQVASARGDYQAGRAKLAESNATNLKLQQDAERYQALLEGGVAARQQ